MSDNETNETRVYGVSGGNGNDGVSHMYANYYVRTDDPWKLARRAALSEFKPEYREQIEDVLEIDGDGEYTIFAIVYEDPFAEPPTVACEDCGGTGYGDAGEDCVICDGEGAVYDDNYEPGPAWFILEVFLEKDEDWLARRTEGPYGVPIYNSIEEALSEELSDNAHS